MVGVKWPVLGYMLCVVAGVWGLSPVVHTPYGTVRGVRDVLRPDFYVDKFLGIPYASAPVGNLRFSPPQPVAQWNGTRDTDHIGPMCPQPHDSYILPQQVFPQSEDCLFLNVYTPKVADKSSRLPVMVWIHGGGFYLGSGGRFAWTQLAAEGVVVVSINYRLDVLGFLSMEDSTIAGNYGLQDQILALAWVRDVISSFHGDPNDVTIFGESAGAASVSLLLLSREAQGLFHKAIAESGSSFSDFAMSYPGVPPDPRQQAVQLGKYLGCDATDSSRLLECLRIRDVQHIRGASDARRAATHMQVFKPIAEPTFGERGVFAGTPDNLLRHHAFNDVPIIRGFNHHEAAFGLQDPGDDGFTMAEFRRQAEATCRLLLQHPSLTLDVDDVITQVVDAYVTTPNVTDPKMLRQAFIQLKTDLVFSTPMLLELTLATLHSTQPQYLYQFVYKSANRQVPPWKGAQHTDEIPYVCGAPVADVQVFPNYVTSWTDDDIRMSRDVMTMWSNFAKYGNPSPSPVNGTTWLPWTGGSHRLLEIGSPLRMINNPLTPQQKLWMNILSQMHTDISASLIG